MANYIMQCCVCYKIKTGGKWVHIMDDPCLVSGSHGYCHECRKVVEKEIQDLINARALCALDDKLVNQINLGGIK